MTTKQTANMPFFTTDEVPRQRQSGWSMLNLAAQIVRNRLSKEEKRSRHQSPFRPVRRVIQSAADPF